MWQYERMMVVMCIMGAIGVCYDVTGVPYYAHAGLVIGQDLASIVNCTISSFSPAGATTTTLSTTLPRGHCQSCRISLTQPSLFPNVPLLSFAESTPVGGGTAARVGVGVGGSGSGSGSGSNRGSC